MSAGADMAAAPSRLAALAGSRGAAAALALLAVALAATLLAGWIAPQNPYDLSQLDILDGMLPPGSARAAGGRYWLGTDDQGRDILSGILYGLRVSLAVGAGSALVALAIGAGLGLLAAYMGGRTDALAMRAVDLQLSFPSILVALMVVGFLGKGVANVMLALVVAEWAWFARTVRAAAMVELRQPYMEAARALQLGALRVVLRHLLPNCATPIVVMATMQMARAIALEATLSFLGLGVPVTQPSLGLLIANGYAFMLSGHHWVSLYPGLALIALIVALNLVGERIRVLADPRAGGA